MPLFAVFGLAVGPVEAFGTGVGFTIGHGSGVLNVGGDMLLNLGQESNTLPVPDSSKIVKPGPAPKNDVPPCWPCGPAKDAPEYSVTSSVSENVPAGAHTAAPFTIDAD